VLHSENVAEPDAVEEIVKITGEKKDSKREFNKTFHGPKAPTMRPQPKRQL